MSKVIGIDLGTTYCCVAVADEAGAHVLLNRMGQWKCGMDIGLIDSTLTESSYTYKVRANEAVLKLKIEGTMEALGLQGGVTPRGSNELVVTAIPIRTN